jgi:hypothetical protein
MAKIEHSEDADKDIGYTMAEILILIIKAETII